MTAENARSAVTDAPGHVLHVHVENAVLELVDELHVIDALIAEMARVIVESEGRMEIHRLQRALGAGDVERDLRGMHFERETHALLLKLIEDRLEALREVLVAVFDLPRQVRREGIDEMPDAAAGEAVHDLHAKAFRGLRRLHELFSGAAAHTFRFAIAVNVIWQDLLVTRIDVVAHSLADEVRADRMALQTGFFDQRTLRVAILLIRLGDFEVISPAPELDAVITEGLGFFEEGRERKVSPLTGEKSDRTWH